MARTMAWLAWPRRADTRIFPTPCLRPPRHAPMPPMSGDPLRRLPSDVAHSQLPACRRCSRLFQASPWVAEREDSAAAKNVGAKFHQNQGRLTAPFPWPGESRSQPPRLVWPLGNALSTKPPTSSTCHAQAAAATPLLVRGGLPSVPLVPVAVPSGSHPPAVRSWGTVLALRHPCPPHSTRGPGSCLPVRTRAKGPSSSS